ncbi:MAG: hypothetical protein JWO60_1695, partial [Frankiales bacterium]|nr:hypothetical protein [Frankiales bacterium]
ATGRARPAPDLRDDALVEREAGVRALLQARAAAVQDRDRAAWLATVDPAQPAFRARQAALFDALAGVPLQEWEYVLDPDTEQPADPALDRRYGRGWWAPSVALHYRLTGYDDGPAVQQQALTLVLRGGRWLVAADDDFAAAGQRTARGLWDVGPVVAVAEPRVLVLGHPGDEALLREVAAAVQEAVPRVTGFWGEDWAQRVVVLVPGDAQELRTLVPDGDLTQIAALATTEAGAGPGAPVGDRVVVNPGTFRRLGAVGRRVVLTHEVTHVATRAATGSAVPAWLVEGLADHVGYLGAEVPLRVAARDLRAAVRRGRVPDTLPPDSAFDGSSADLGQAYEQAWLAVDLLVQRYGDERVVAFYRAVGRAHGSAEVADAFATHLGTTEQELTQAWRASLDARLG